MGARELRVGAEYATASGLPVRVVAVNGYVRPDGVAVIPIGALGA